ncbi:TIGR02391 family protein [Microbacterium oleivorans]|uniref:TIGR02391 family protein n=1 Tax=Microbacterium oleivorans TaxID=273677 RepID=UPI000767B442|nr:TIGR02391 family protein [Microbacterium oleivorans]
MTDDSATEWMIEHLKNHREVLDQQGWEHYGAKVEGLEVTRRIVERVLPGESFDIDPLNNDAWEYFTTTAISRALGVLENRRQILAYLGPSGPTMPVDNLHPVVWTNAAELWKIEQYRAAVARAATFLNAHIQDKSTRTDLSDKGLMTQVFSPDPATDDKPRLRWNGQGNHQTSTSMASGLLNFSQGVSLAIRNPATHETAEMPRQVAVEQLAAMSMLARWVDECRLDRGV